MAIRLSTSFFPLLEYITINSRKHVNHTKQYIIMDIEQQEHCKYTPQQNLRVIFKVLTNTLGNSRLIYNVSVIYEQTLKRKRYFAIHSSPPK